MSTMGAPTEGRRSLTGTFSVAMSPINSNQIPLILILKDDSEE
jgi:hypothetical protein